MKTRYLAALLSTLLIAGCGGGGGSTNAGTSLAPAIPVATTSPPGPATVPMTISIPRTPPSASARAARFFSPGTGSLAVYDGATLIYVANLSLDSSTQFATVYAKSGSTTVAPGTCSFTSSTATCTLTITSTVGAHKFDLVTYPGSQSSSGTGTPPAFTGVVASEGELSVTLSPGTNPGQTLTMLGVASNVIIAGAANGPYNQATQFGYRIQDSTNAQIVLPGAAYDNGPVTITAAPSGIVTIAPNSIATPPATAGDQNFNVTCVNASGGSVTISFNARTSPNTAYASGLTYSTSNYSAAVIATTTFSCDPSSATIPITVQ
ncbi:MAG TPA: hypothetical protein VN224_02630 [Xanthomonadales bacterium]|nr:hypothetical protein [Xanthomonadales bacterium]